MKYEQALQIGKDAGWKLYSYCERIEFAGGLRRHKAEPHDIEIIVIPNMIPENIGMFTGVNFPDEPVPMVSALTDEVISAIGKPIKNGERMKQIELAESIMLDLFIVIPPAQWGLIYLIRTGPADYSHWLVTQRKHGGALPSNLRVKNGGIYADEKLIETPEEKDVFALLGMAYVEPEKRQAPDNFLARQR